MFSSFFHTVFYQPLLNLFVFLYNVLPGHDLGVAIIILTILIRLALYPLTSSSIRAQKSMQDLQPKLEAIRKQFPGDKQKQAQATMELYKTSRVNPVSSCLPVLIQLPFLIALYMVLRDGLTMDVAKDLYGIVHSPGTLSPITLKIFDLSKPSVVLAFLAGIAQFLQAKTLMRKPAPPEAGAGGKDENMMAMMNKQMLYFMPAMTIIIGLRFPAGLTLYWFFSTILMVLQQMLLLRKGKKNIDAIEGKIVE